MRYVFFGSGDVRAGWRLLAFILLPRANRAAPRDRFRVRSEKRDNRLSTLSGRDSGPNRVGRDRGHHPHLRHVRDRADGKVRASRARIVRRAMAARIRESVLGGHALGIRCDKLRDCDHRHRWRRPYRRTCSTKCNGDFRMGPTLGVRFGDRRAGRGVAVSRLRAEHAWVEYRVLARSRDPVAAVPQVFTSSTLARPLSVSWHSGSFASRSG